MNIVTLPDQELAALLDLAGRAPKTVAEALWLDGLNRHYQNAREAALAKAAQPQPEPGNEGQEEGGARC